MDIRNPRQRAARLCEKFDPIFFLEFIVASPWEREGGRRIQTVACAWRNISLLFFPFLLLSESGIISLHCCEPLELTWEPRFQSSLQKKYISNQCISVFQLLVKIFLFVQCKRSDAYIITSSCYHKWSNMRETPPLLKERRRKALVWLQKSTNKSLAALYDTAVFFFIFCLPQK